MGDGSIPRVAGIDLTEVLPDRDFVAADLMNFNPDITAIGPPFVGATVLGYGIEGEEGVAKLERALRRRADNASGGRFNKTDALYAPIAPPPGVWDYRCRNCRFYQPGSGGSDGGRCAIVGHEEDPLGGRSISPEAWCALWLPEDGTEWFDYVRRRVEGDGT